MTRPPAIAEHPGPVSAGRAAWRALGLFGVWTAINGADPAGLVVGLGAAALGAWASLVLLPGAARRINLGAVFLLVLRFPPQALRAGFEVAMRALAPRLTLRPGLFVHPTRLSPGLPRDGFATYASLLPGTVLVGASADGAGLLVHALDTGPETAASLTREETLFARGAGLDG